MAVVPSQRFTWLGLSLLSGWMQKAWDLAVQSGAEAFAMWRNSSVLYPTLQNCAALQGILCKETQREEDEMNSSGAYMQVIRNRNAAAILTADALNKYGDWLVFIGANVFLYQQGGPIAIGLYAVARVGIPMIATPFAGQIGMRFDPRSVMLAAAMARAATFAVLAALFALGEVASAPSWQLVIVILVIAGILTTPYVPAERRLVRKVVPDDILGQTNALMVVIASTSVIVAPAIGSVVQGTLGLFALFAINAAMYGGVFAALLFAAAPSPDSTEVSRQPLLPGVGNGARVIFADRRTLAMVLLQTAGTAVAGSTIVLLVPLSDEMGNVDYVGFFLSIIGLASLLGALVGGGVAAANRSGFALASVALCCVLLVPMTLMSGGIVLFVVVLIALGFLANVADPLYWTTFQRRVPEKESGAAFGFIDANITLTMVVSQGIVGFALAATNLLTVGLLIGVGALTLVGISAWLIWGTRERGRSEMSAGSA